VAGQLAALGIGRLILIDAGLVSAKHHASEGYFAEDAGRQRVHATAELCHRLNPLLEVETRARSSIRQCVDVDAVFCCTGSANQRGHARRAFARKVRFFAFAADHGAAVSIVIVGPGRTSKSFGLAGVTKRLALPNVGLARQWVPWSLPVNSMAASMMVAEFLRRA
jgi:hypothetical protein